MHFLLIESLYKKETDPVIFFLNDGPGYAAISSALNGLGPVYFYPPSGQFIQLYHNWCNNATVIFLDGPPGTGFSKVERNLDFISNEASYIKDAMSFIL